MFMSRLMIVVEFEVKPEHRSAFVELMKGHARLSRTEDGCQQFDVLLPQEDQNRGSVRKNHTRAIPGASGEAGA
jgi:quinol monooxygenase YgiN